MGCGLGSAATGLVAQAVEICKINKEAVWKSSDDCKCACFNFKQIPSRQDAVQKQHELRLKETLTVPSNYK
jgi:hypothetical protein